MADKLEYGHIARMMTNADEYGHIAMMMMTNADEYGHIAMMTKDDEGRVHRDKC